MSTLTVPPAVPVRTVAKNASVTTDRVLSLAAILSVKVYRNPKGALSVSATGADKIAKAIK